MRRTLQVLNGLELAGVLRRYAIGGAMGARKRSARWCGSRRWRLRCSADEAHRCECGRAMT